MNDKVNQLAQANVQLIKSIHNQYLDKVQTVVHQSVLNGKLNRDLLKSLKEIGNITEKEPNWSQEINQANLTERLTKHGRRR